MKTQYFIIQLIAALFFAFLSYGSGKAQSIISSVNVSNNAALVSNHLIQSTSEVELNTNTENWMMKRNYLDSKSVLTNYKTMMLLNEKVIENKREIENWMFDKYYWEIKNNELADINESHKKIENWMMDPNFWVIEIEKARIVEPWMLDQKYWVISE